MMLSFVAASIMNLLFTIGWLEENGEDPDRNLWSLGQFSNFLKALDVASERKVMPKFLRLQRIFYIQAALCIVLLLIVTALNSSEIVK
jgi:hypothetical protein